GDVVWRLPYARMRGHAGDPVAQEPTTILAIHRDHLREMIRECHEITSILVHIMIDRARVFTSSDLHDEKMVSLGKLSAGLAHELNNPASAIERSAALLEDRLEEADEATRAVGATRLTDAQLAAASGVRAACVATRVVGVPSPIEQAEREEAITDWLANHGLDPAFAEALAESTVTLGALDRVAGAIDGPPLDAVLRWAATGCTVRRLASEIHEAATRIRLGLCNQGCHAHGSGSRRRASELDTGLGEHSRGAQVEGTKQVGGGGRRCRSQSPACPRFRRRAESGVGEFDRQCARRHPRLRPCRDLGEARASACGGARRRQSQRSP